MGNTMQAEASHTTAAPNGTLAELGAGIRQRRKQLRVSATAAAEAAGLSRVTLHRIERGEPSVAMGLYQRATAALGLKLQLADELPAPQARDQALPARLHLADLPELRRLAWQLDPATELTPGQALDLYERNWRHLDSAAMTPHERAVLGALVQSVGGGRLLV
jgi:transcriptional regulator with XRE-family HTH domain